MKPRFQLGSILLRYGVISEAELDHALTHQREHQVRIGEALVALGYCLDSHVARALADQFELPFVDFDQQPPTLDALRLVSCAAARRLGAVPVERQNGRLLVVAKNPLDYSIDTALREVSGLPVTVAAGIESQIDHVLQRYDLLLMGSQPAQQRIFLNYVSERLGSRNQLQGIERFQHASCSTERMGLLISQSLENGAEVIRISIKQDAVRVSGVIDGTSRCLGFLSGDELDLVIEAPRRWRRTGQPEVALPSPPPQPG